MLSMFIGWNFGGKNLLFLIKLGYLASIIYSSYKKKKEKCLFFPFDSFQTKELMS